MSKINIKILTLLFIIAFLISSVIFYKQHEKNVLNEANKRITTILNTNKALHKYVENTQKPVIYQLQAEGKLYPEFFDPKLLSFTYIARNIHDNYMEIEKESKNTPYIYKLAATNPRNPVNKASEFEADILNKFRSGELETYETILTQNDQEYFFKGIPIDKNKASCMRCHSKPINAPKEMLDQYGTIAGFDEKIGDIRAMISLKIPISTIRKDSLNKFYTDMVVLFLIFSIFYMILVALLKKDKRLVETNKLLEKSIEETRIKNEEIKQKDKMLADQAKMSALGEMIGNIAHQWRQPLSSISTVSSSMQVYNELGTLDSEQINKNCELINNNTQFLSKTIDDFRNYIKGDRVKESFSIKKYMDNFKDLISSDLKSESIDLIMDIDENLVINSYPNELTQCFMNIFNNTKDALENISSEKYLFIDIKDKDDNAIITIKDNAGGIADDIIEKIFEPYFTTKHQSQGTGLGLHMTYNIVVNGMNGSIIVENDSYKYNDKEYKGAKFIIVIPKDTKEKL